jgi:hypothetical protein
MTKRYSIATTQQMVEGLTGVSAPESRSRTCRGGLMQRETGRSAFRTVGKERTLIGAMLEAADQFDRLPQHV